MTEEAVVAHSSNRFFDTMKSINSHGNPHLEYMYSFKRENMNLLNRYAERKVKMRSANR